MDAVNIDNQPLSSTIQCIDRTKKTALSGDNLSCIDRLASVEAESVNRKDVLSRKSIPAIEHKVSNDKKALEDIISAIEFTINHSQPHSFQKIKKEVKLKGASLLEAKYDLRENCINTCIPLNKALQYNKHLKELGYRVGLSLVKETGEAKFLLIVEPATIRIIQR